MNSFATALFRNASLEFGSPGSVAGAAAYAASCAQDFPDASELIEELFERWDSLGNLLPTLPMARRREKRSVPILAALTALAARAAKIKVVADVGRKLVATSNVEAGEVMLQESPLLTWKRGSTLETARDAMFAFSKLPFTLQEQIRGFYCPTIPPPQIRLLDNTFERQELQLLSTLEVCCCGTFPGSVALFEHVACANHSCKPNAAIRINTNEELRFIALRSVAKGEEVCISYIGDELLLKPSNLRRKALRPWGFQCSCPRCCGFDDTRGTSRRLEARWWRKWMSLREEQEASDDARMRRWALGLGSREQWERRAQRLRKRKWLQKLVNFFEEILEELQTEGSEGSEGGETLHWLLSTVAKDASEAHLWRGELQEAIRAANYWRRFVHQLLGTTMSLETGFKEASLALEVQAAATEMDAEAMGAAQLYRNALQEAEPLHNAWDENDFFVPYLRNRVDQLT
eukprot:Skav235970  [mRNA]  locus=scaffold592:172045:176360:- [translate_table: standard]